MRSIPPRMAKARRALPSLAFVAAAFGASPALAQDIGDPATIGTLSCANIAGAAASLPDLDHKGGVWRAVPVARVAYFIETSTGQITTPSEAMVKLGLLRATHYPAGAGKVWDTVYTFQAELLAGNIDGIGAFTADGKPIEASARDDETPWLLEKDVILRCKVPDLKPTQVVDNAAGTGGGKPKAKLPFTVLLRGTTDALKATGKDRKSADAASFNFSRVKAYQDDDSRKTTETYSAKAILGVPIFTDGEKGGLVAYGGYELKQERTDPPPELDPPATQRDGDTEVIKLGLIGHRVLPLGGSRNRYSVSLDVALDGSYLFDQVKDSERLRLRTTGNLFISTDFGICKIGDYRQFEGTKLWTRCDVQAIFDINDITKVGELDLTGDETFGHAGPSVSFKAFLGDTLDDGPFFTAEWMHLVRIDGDTMLIPDIERHKFVLGYRWWSAEDFALEIKAELLDGINPDSLDDENSLSFGFGIIF